MADKLVNKRLVDIDALMNYLENDTDLGYASDFMASLQIAVNNFIATTVPDVDVYLKQSNTKIDAKDFDMEAHV